MNCSKTIRDWYAKIGAMGGARSRRTITPDQQKKMQQARRRMRKIRKRRYSLEELNCAFIEAATKTNDRIVAGILKPNRNSPFGRIKKRKGAVMPEGYLKIKLSIQKRHPDWPMKKVEEHAARIWNAGKAGTGQTVGKGKA